MTPYPFRITSPHYELTRVDVVQRLTRARKLILGTYRDITPAIHRKGPERPMCNPEDRMAFVADMSRLHLTEDLSDGERFLRQLMIHCMANGVMSGGDTLNFLPLAFVTPLSPTTVYCPPLMACIHMATPINRDQFLGLDLHTPSHRYLHPLYHDAQGGNVALCVKDQMQIDFLNVG